MHRTRRHLLSIAAILGLAAVTTASVAQAAPATGAVPSATSATARALSLLPARVTAGVDIRMTRRRYALCAASNTIPSHTTIVINRRTYQVGTGVCPIMNGWTIYNASLQGLRARVKGRSTIWSSFGAPTSMPLYNPASGWSVGPPKGRTFIMGTAPNTGMANFWGFPCVVIRPVTIGGTEYPMAMCAGPLNENLDNLPVRTGGKVFTTAAASAPMPVGVGTTAVGQIAGLESFLLPPSVTA